MPATLFRPRPPTTRINSLKTNSAEGLLRRAAMVDSELLAHYLAAKIALAQVTTAEERDRRADVFARYAGYDSVAAALAAISVNVSSWRARLPDEDPAGAVRAMGRAALLGRANYHTQVYYGLVLLPDVAHWSTWRANLPPVELVAAATYPWPLEGADPYPAPGRAQAGLEWPPPGYSYVQATPTPASASVWTNIDMTPWRTGR